MHARPRRRPARRQERHASLQMEAGGYPGREPAGRSRLPRHSRHRRDGQDRRPWHQATNLPGPPWPGTSTRDGGGTQSRSTLDSAPHVKPPAPPYPGEPGA
jgi:hypothetical protein